MLTHKVLVIFNPEANRGRNLRMAEDMHEQIAHRGGVEWISTDAPGHATRLAAQAANEGFGCVVAIGGDGTVHEVVNGLMQITAGSRPQLGIVPVGSGNDFVRGAATTSNPNQALEHVFNNGKTVSIDIGLLRMDGQKDCYWLNVLGIGFDAAVTLQSQRMRHLHGKMMYFMAAIRTIIENYNAPGMSMDIDGEQFTQRVLMLTIGNGTREGGGFITTPDSRIDDGLLDFCMFQPVSRLMMVRLIPEVMRGTHTRFHQVRMGRLKRMNLHADQPLLIHTDGEVMAKYGDNMRTIEVGVCPGAICLIA
jgi:diacylglycerol kinase (ATP)